jgi:hypothetical protein
VRKRFPPETIDALRKSWNLGEVPFLESLNQLKVKGKGFAGPDQAFFWRPFVEINFQVHYVEGWGRFAGIWFEEIEPWIKQKESEVEA